MALASPELHPSISNYMYLNNTHQQQQLQHQYLPRQYMQQYPAPYQQLQPLQQQHHAPNSFMSRLTANNPYMSPPGGSSGGGSGSGSVQPPLQLSNPYETPAFYSVTSPSSSVAVAADQRLDVRTPFPPSSSNSNSGDGNAANSSKNKGSVMSADRSLSKFAADNASSSNANSASSSTGQLAAAIRALQAKQAQELLQYKSY